MLIFQITLQRSTNYFMEKFRLPTTQLIVISTLRITTRLTVFIQSTQLSFKSQLIPQQRKKDCSSRNKKLFERMSNEHSDAANQVGHHQGLVRCQKKQGLRRMIKTCLILHNLIIEDECKIEPAVWTHYYQKRALYGHGTIQTCLPTSQLVLTAYVIEQRTKF